MKVIKREIELRLNKFKETIKTQGLSVVLIFSPLNIFYFTHTFVRGVLIISTEEVKLLVNRPWERAKKESLVPFEPLKSFKDLSLILKAWRGKALGLEINALTPELYFKYQELLEDFQIKKVDYLILEQRMLKSFYEIFCIKRAGKFLAKALRRALKKFKPGMSELLASALLEKELRSLGHPGMVRSLYGFELTYGHLLSGKEALEPIHFITGQGGRGILGFPSGATAKRLRRREPILIDFAGYFRGYYIDQTRMVSFGKVPQAEAYFKCALNLLKVLEKEVKEGITASEVYEKALDLVQQEGLKDYFMAHGEVLNFVGHGVGLQIDEPPALAKNQKTVLKENMVLALEPKFHVPNLGVIGIEETYLVTKRGLRALNSFPRDWVYL
ncbi:MAG: Xaa-Pro peptidase family protein [Thermodesulfobacteriaceae bacterium]|nr:Xaa-Pro peptidase family protein [Thermodesulfobacteriaceae bacterium]MCX8041103.1 Xaa-Pro peptidase family protein [Thermodesulfobacteriaceae bacterium]MDW8135544.1 Xaa-Pro peptidase family protein [Thermodesulfobacterium sp.]